MSDVAPITIGIHLHSEPERLEATLAHLRGATSDPFEIILLPDGPDATTWQALARHSDLPQSATVEPQGAAAAFNRLLRASHAPLLIFLEAGALPGPGWLARLRAALEADARHGLAGPSTNRSWNRQAVFPDSREADIPRTAALAATRFGDGWETLDPLHCLADFCYAVRREVVDVVGFADEAYGRGPCWEMDYTLRAARAGFRALWAKGAFVHRRPFTHRRQLDEARLFEASKRRYQDKFCGRRLAGEQTAYKDHCRGETCIHFAPADHIRIHLAADQDPQPPSVGATAPATSAALQPLVSCIMPTRDRPDFLRQSIHYFLRQDYANRELIIVDDSLGDAPDLPADPRIRTIRLDRQTPIGGKRNRACALAQGAIIVHWDDDDWYAPNRLRAQVEPILAGRADITALGGTRFFDLKHWQFWECAPELHSRMFVLNVHGGTLAFRREVFANLARYPDVSLAEDAKFLMTAVERGARLETVAGDDLFLYLRHRGNAWAFRCGQYLDTSGWRRIHEPLSLGADRDFYAERSDAAQITDRLPAATGGLLRKQQLAPAAPQTHPNGRSADALPLVTCIMPTHNRRKFVPQAIEYFLRQDYPNCELIILDDGDDSVADLVPDLPSITYQALPSRMPLGAKRNAAIEAGRGDIILHWDDDDWMDDRRVSVQVSALLSAGADICGSSRIWFCEIATGRFSIYRHPPGRPRWLYGASLCYRRALWRQKHFESVDNGEDTRFVWTTPMGELLDLEDQRFMVAIVHDRNTSTPRPLSSPHWTSQDQETKEDIIGGDWAFYEALQIENPVDAEIGLR